MNKRREREGTYEVRYDLQGLGCILLCFIDEVFKPHSYTEWLCQHSESLDVTFKRGEIKSMGLIS